MSKISVRLANISDIRFTLNLYNQNIVNKKFFSRKTISMSEHEKWFKKKLKEKMIFICSVNSRIGYIRYDHLDENSLSVSIAIKEKYKRNGFGKTMLRKTMLKKKIVKYKIFAHVKDDNFSSKKFFLNNGFKQINKNIFLNNLKQNKKIYK